RSPPSARCAAPRMTTRKASKPGPRSAHRCSAAARRAKQGQSMRRRELMLLLGGAAITPRSLPAQQRAVPVIGYLFPASPVGPALSSLAALLQGLSEVGYVEGQNLAIEYRWAEGYHDRLPALAADLVGRKVDLIVAVGEAAVTAKSATST